MHIYWKDWYEKAEAYIGEKQLNVCMATFGNKITSIHTETYIDADKCLYAVYYNGEPEKWETEGPYMMITVCITPDGKWSVNKDEGRKIQNWNGEREAANESGEESGE